MNARQDEVRDPEAGSADRPSKADPADLRYCSSCFARSTHDFVDKGRWRRNRYCCAVCGATTVLCMAPGCTHMARGPRAKDDDAPRRDADQFCAEHSDEIASFDKLGVRKRRSRPPGCDIADRGRRRCRFSYRLARGSGIGVDRSGCRALQPGRSEGLGRCVCFQVRGGQAAARAWPTRRRGAERDVSLRRPACCSAWGLEADRRVNLLISKV